MTTAPPEWVVDAGLDVPVESRRSVMRDARDELRDVLRYRSLVGFLVASSLRAEGANTVLGVAWWALDPMLLAAVYVVLVGGILGRGGEDFPIFILIALIAWELFTNGSRGAATTTLRKERSMRQVAFPKSVVPLSSVLTEAVHFAFAFLVLLLAAIPFGIRVKVNCTSAMGTTSRPKALGSYLFRVWLYLSPALYPVSLIRERFFVRLQPWFAKVA